MDIVKEIQIICGRITSKALLKIRNQGYKSVLFCKVETIISLAILIAKPVLNLAFITVKPGKAADVGANKDPNGIKSNPDTTRIVMTKWLDLDNKNLASKLHFVSLDSIVISHAPAPHAPASRAPAKSIQFNFNFESNLISVKSDGDHKSRISSPASHAPAKSIQFNFNFESILISVKSDGDLKRRISSINIVSNLDQELNETVSTSEIAVVGTDLCIFNFVNSDIVALFNIIAVIRVVQG